MIYSCKPSRVGIYINAYPYKSMAQIKQETGCDIICNGQMFNSDWSPTHNMRADGETLAYEANYLGYGWNKDDSVLTMTRDYAAFDNFLSCVALIDKASPLPLRAGVDYPAALRGTRGRTAIGITADGRLVLFCSSDGSSAAKTMKEIQQAMMAQGCVTALNLDGGASCSCITPTGTIETSRTIHNYVCIWTDDPDAKEETPLFKIALGAGHGLTTPGKRCDKTLDPKETPEWWLNDRICDMVESYLKDYEGYEILRLDDSDDGADDIALASRVSRANTWKADVYVSVHHNAGANRTNAGGICAFSYPNSTKGAQWRDAFYEALIDHAGLKGNRAQPKLSADFYVLKHTNMPAVLLELGFMDSKVDVPIILTDKFAKQCAQAIVEVLVIRGGLKKRAKTADSVLYKVQVGAFSNKENADKLLLQLKTEGYQAYIVKV